MFDFYRVLLENPSNLNGKGWEPHSLSMNPYLPLQYVIENPQGVQDQNGIYKPWYYNIIARYNVDVKFMLENPIFEIKQIIFNDNFKLEYILEYPDIEFPLNKISEHTDLDLKFIKDNPSLGWNWNYIRYHDKYYHLFQDKKYFDWVEQIESIVDGDGPNVNYTEVTHHIILTDPSLRLIHKYPDRDWDYYLLSQYISEEFFLEHQDKDWNYVALSVRFSWNFIKNNPNVPWDYYKMSYRDDIDWEFVILNSDKNWYWVELSSNKLLPWRVVRDNLHLPWKLTLVRNRPISEVITHLDEYNQRELSSLFYSPDYSGLNTKSARKLGCN